MRRILIGYDGSERGDDALALGRALAAAADDAHIVVATVYEALLPKDSHGTPLPREDRLHAEAETQLQRARVAYDARLVRFGTGSTPDGYAHAMELMGLDDPPTAIFCANDRTAWGAYQALAELGLSVPDDVSIVGFDNQDIIAGFLRPGLTTMNLPFREMGWEAVDLLLRGAADRTPDSEGRRSLLVRCDLVTRGSVAAPKGRGR